MSYNVATDPDDLLRKIPPNITRDMEIVMRRIEGLLPSLYRGLRTVLSMVRPWSLLYAMYRRELGVVEEILRFLDDPGKSYLIGLPFQPVAIEDDNITVIDMVVSRLRIEILEPTKCTALIFPVTIMYPDIALRSVLIHELVHCITGDPYGRVAYKVEMMLTNIAPILFPAVKYTPLLRAGIEYIRQNRVPVISHETYDIVADRIARDPEYADQIFSKSAVIRLKPRAFWKS